MRFRNAFTAMRYLFDPENANTSIHLQNPDHMIILVCVMNALERACGGPHYFRNVGGDYSNHPERELKLHEDESGQYSGSMYGVVDSLHNATEAMRQLEEYLPNGFMWPTNVDVSPGRVTVRWAQGSLKGTWQDYTRRQRLLGGHTRGCNHACLLYGGIPIRDGCQQAIRG